MNAKTKISLKGLRHTAGATKRTVRKHLNADSLFLSVKKDFQKIPDKRRSNSKIALDDALMSALAMFQLKDPSLLAFDTRRLEEPENLHTIFKVKNIPCDSQMRSILDPLSPASLRAPFRTVFRQLQRGKGFEDMTYLGGHYLLSGDGTGFYTSNKVSSPYCMGKKKKNGTTEYYQQMYAACFVHPETKVVIPVFPEMITQKDGQKKGDCERNAAKRFYPEFRREHPHLQVIVVEDGLSSNGPHIKTLKELDLRFILGAKPSDHKALFTVLQQGIQDGRATEFHYLDAKDRTIGHFFKFMNTVPLNKSNPDLMVNVLEYSEISGENKIRTFSWVTDIEITDENVHEIMKAGRARWRIENETFNTLKNQGYHLGHNFGLGKQNLSVIFTTLMMLAFLIDQAQQMSCWLFQAALQSKRGKRYFWEEIRHFFHIFHVDSMETILRAIAHGFEKRNLHEEMYDT